jgi:hypothetical protein
MFTCTSVIYTRIDYDTHECDYDKYKCDFYTHELYLNTLRVVL